MLMGVFISSVNAMGEMRRFKNFIRFVYTTIGHELTVSGVISTCIHAYNGFNWKSKTLYFNEFNPSLLNRLAPVTNFS